MSHFFPASAVVPLSSGVIAATGELLLIGARCPSNRLAASDSSALPGTVDLPAIAPPADHDLHAAAGTDERSGRFLKYGQKCSLT
jgi:hypothetical protein